MNKLHEAKKALSERDFDKFVFIVNEVYKNNPYEIATRLIYEDLLIIVNDQEFEFWKEQIPK
jgi:hypothetical protein